METIHRYCILILSAILLLSCSRESAPSGGAVESYELSFVACLPSTRVEVAPSGKVCWSEGDAIAVYNGAGQKFLASLSGGAGTAEGSFVCPSFSGSPAGAAVFPYDFAGDAPGKISIPWQEERSERTPALMVSDVEALADGTLPSAALHFRHLAAVVDITLHDTPSYARALVLKAGGRIGGNFSFDVQAPSAVRRGDGTSSRMITFPGGEGYGSDLHFRLFLPVGDYSFLSLSILDGDETPIEGLEELKFGAGSLSFSAGDYLAMPVLDVRSKCLRDSSIRKVEGICWAAGNLIAQQGGPTSDGFQEGWRIAEEQWQFLGCDKLGTSTGASFTQGPAAFDRFNYGGLAGDAWRPDSGYMLPSDARFSISGKVFSLDSGSREQLDAFQQEGKACFAVPSGGSFATGGTLHGDVAFWASKGQYRMPTAAEIVTLRAGNSPANASGQAGWVDDGGNRIYGMLLTSTPSWETSTLNTTARELTAADLEAGLFLPKAGRGRYIDGSTTSLISYVNSQGYYRSGTFSALDLDKYPSCDHATTVLGFRAANSCDYGYTVHLNSDSAWGVGHVQKCLPIRPVLNSEAASAVPDPMPQPSERALAPWSEGCLDIHAINSGRGECTLVIMPDGTSMMIDAGEYYSSAESAVAQKPSSSVRPYKVYTCYAKYFLEPTGHPWLDYFLLSHYHIDHMGQKREAWGTSGNGYARSGVMAVYDDLPIHKLVDRCGPSASPSTEDYSSAVYEEFRKFAAYRQENDGMEWYAVNLNAGGNYRKQFVPKYDSTCGVTVYNLGGNGKYWNGSGFSTYPLSLTENGSCTTQLISYGDFDYWTGGDCACQTKVMQLIASGLGKKVEAMKAGHHMYYNTLDAATAAILQPKVTVAQIFDSDKPGDPAFSLHSGYGDVFCTNLHPGRLDNSASIKGGTPVSALGSKVRDYGGHFVIRVSPGGGSFMVYKLRDTDFSFEVLASYGPYSCEP